MATHKGLVKLGGAVTAGVGLGAVSGFVSALLRRRPATSYAGRLHQLRPGEDGTTEPAPKQGADPPMGRRLVSITLDNVDDIAMPCRECVLWERGSREPDRAAKADWVSAVLLDWGSCGRVAYVDGQVAAFALYAPPEYVEGLGVLATSSTSEDAVLLMTARVLPAFAGSGLGRVLTQTVVKDLMRRRGVKAIEAFGDVQGHENHCLVPARFLTAVGFKTVQPHPRYPRLRLELRNVLTWREDVEVALERWLGAIRPAARPEAGRGPVGVSPRRVEPEPSPRPSPNGR